MTSLMGKESTGNFTAETVTFRLSIFCSWPSGLWRRWMHRFVTFLTCRQALSPPGPDQAPLGLSTHRTLKRVTMRDDLEGPAASLRKQVGRPAKPGKSERAKRALIATARPGAAIGSFVRNRCVRVHARVGAPSRVRASTDSAHWLRRMSSRLARPAGQSILRNPRPARSVTSSTHVTIQP